MAGSWDQERHSNVDALAKYMPIGVETRQEGDTFVRKYILNSCERHGGGGDLSGGCLGFQPICASSMPEVYSS